MEQRIYLPNIQIRTNSLVYFETPEPPYNHKRHQLNQYKTYSGTVTDHAATRISRSIDVFLQKSKTRLIPNKPPWPAEAKFRLSFLTLTISQSKEVDATEGYKALKVFLGHFREKPAKKAISEQLKSYIWKAELQQRGQLHYHVTTNSFLHYAEVNRVWNGIQDRRGWLDEFRQDFGHSNAPSTEVRAVYKSRNIGGELAKYLMKTGKSDVSEYGFPQTIFTPHINGKVWDCSNDLKVPRFSDELDYQTKERIYQAMRDGSARHLKFPRCSVFTHDRPAALLSLNTLQNYRNWQNL